MDQGQNQSQTQTVQISVASAGDLELEQGIFRDVSSVGRQLATVLDVLDELLTAVASNSQSTAVQGFRELRTQIAEEKLRVARERLGSLGDPDRLVEALDALLQSDPASYEAYRERLALWTRSAVSPGALNR